jgi:hypothetical protein
MSGMDATLPATRTLLPRIHWRPLLNAFAVVFLFVFWRHLLSFQGDAVDAHAYWLTDLSNLYRIGDAGELDAYLYAPPFAQLIAPLTALPFELFWALWMAASIGALVWLVGPVVAALLMFLVPWQQDVLTDNIHLMMTVAVVAGFRYPAAWSFVLLTKITPGVGLLWFVVRREWRQLAIALGGAAAIALVSFVIAPALWFDWLGMLTANASAPYDGRWAIPVPLLARLPIAAVIVALGAWRGWRWTVPLAAMLALPILWYWNSLAMLAGMYAVWRRSS